jgi:hypothetical protein
LQQPPDHHLAQLNIGRIRYEIDDPGMADLTNNLALVNGVAERSAGFIRRYADESGNATNTRPYADPRIIVNFSVWESVEALERRFVRRMSGLEGRADVPRKGKSGRRADTPFR